MRKQGPDPDLTISIVSWNTEESLRKCLSLIEACNSRHSFELLVVDNASQDASCEIVRKEFPWVRLFANSQNQGFARANNLAWNHARGRYWMLLNSDAEVREEAIDALIRFIDGNPSARLATARLVNPDGSPQFCAQPSPSILLTLFELSRLHKLLSAVVRGRLFLSSYWSYDRAVQLGWTWGTALIARREAVAEAGPLREDFFMYGEDLEWCLRIRRKGWQIWYCPDAEVVHQGGLSSAILWTETDRMRVKLDATYRAIQIHKGRSYTLVLQACVLLAFALEWMIARTMGRPGLPTVILLTYYRHALQRVASE